MATTTQSPSLSATTQIDSYQNIKDAYTFRSENAISQNLKEKIAVALGYDAGDLTSIPVDANIGEGCGNPLLIASLKEGETVVDLGSGGGFDCLLASKQVGPRGTVIGVDMTENMVALATRNATKLNATNTRFIHAKINSIPVPNDSVDCVMSNCVLNLVPDADKFSVMQEIHRMLKPGGRLAVSDYLALKPLPEAMKNDPVLRAGCISGAVEVAVMQKFLVDVGFEDVLLVNTNKNLEMFKDEDGRKFVTPCCAGESGSCGPGGTTSGRKEVDYDLNEWISSFQIYAHKSSTGAGGHGPASVVTSTDKTASTPLPRAECSPCGPKRCC